jgi:hypothetical protein
MHDKANSLQRINKGNLPGKLEFGCGPTVGRPQHVTIDALDYPTVDVVGDVFDALTALAPGVIRNVYASHFIEHVCDVPELMQRLALVCAPGASLEFVAPHFSNPFYYSDLTHKTPFGLYTFSYITKDCTGMRRGVPNYKQQPDFDIIAVKLGFKSYRPRYIRHFFKKIVEKLVNINNFTRELYEENFTWIAPCYEVTYHLRRRNT